MIIYMLLNTMKLVEPLNHQRIPEIRPFERASSPGSAAVS